jgi:hypothetical protein
MQSTRPAIGAGILLIAIGMLGVAAGRGVTAALAQGTMSPGGLNGGMMGSTGMMGGPFSASARPVSMDQAIQILQQWPAAHHLNGLILDEVEAYTQNYYGQFKEQSTSRGAIQVLIDRYSGQAMPEMGPNMMWNTKYGQMMMSEMMNGMGMGGMMGGGGMPGMMGGGMGSPGMMGAPAPGTGNATLATQISLEDARRAASQFLSGYLPGARVGDGDAFYGYYHFDVLRGIRQVGMVSVNDRTSQVWYHTWHGEFLEKREIAHP